MEHTIEFYVPSTCGPTHISTEELDERTDLIAAEFVTLIGAATVLPATGYWADATGAVIKELIYIVRAFTDNAKLYSNFEALARKYLSVWQQEAILITLDGVGKLIE